MIFFGANDSCVPGSEQHVPLAEYKENLKRLVQHPAVREQNPKIIIITPPPINEYQLFQPDQPKGRTAGHTKSYAEAAREMAASLGVPAGDVWSRFMHAAGWNEGQPLLGSRDIPNSEKLESLFTDGLYLPLLLLLPPPLPLPVSPKKYSC